jgi:hypothetical protein
MKKKLLTIAALILTVVQVNAQGPTLNLVGGSPSLTKGTINTEVLTEIIQQKQEEVKKKVFRNTIVKGFNNSNYTEALKNFTTYHYMYNLMDIMTSGKNKTAITKSITESSTEFSYVLGLALYLQQTADKQVAEKSIDALTINENFIDNAKVHYSSNKVSVSNKVKDFNLLIDLCYDRILNNDSLQKIFKFKEDFKEKDFNVWYESDNCYRKSIIAFDSIQAAKGKIDDYVSILIYTGIVNDSIYSSIKKDEDKKTYLLKQRTKLAELKSQVDDKLTSLLKLIKVGNNVLSTIGELKSSPNSKEELKKKANEILSSLSVLTGKELKEEINKLNSDFANILSNPQKESLTKIAETIDDNYDNFRQLISFYSGLKKSNYKDFTLTKDQYYSMKFVLTKFLELAKNQYENNVVASVIDFMLENTLVEYSDGNYGTQALEENVTNNDKGYLYIDIESLISSIDQKFSPTNKKGLGVYIAPFFSFGTNYASFTGNNQLTTDATGAAKSLSNLYYASEKIGIKWKIWNWKYTHSFGAGENFRYYNSKTNSRYWLRPQPKTTVNDIHLFAYGSGLLYNIANLKSSDNFNYAIAGAGVGMTFFNGLTANFSLACPFTDNKFYSNNMFLNLGFDIPIVEYIAGLRKK